MVHIGNVISASSYQSDSVMDYVESNGINVLPSNSGV